MAKKIKQTNIDETTDIADQVLEDRAPDKDPATEAPMSQTQKDLQKQIDQLKKQNVKLLEEKSKMTDIIANYIAEADQHKEDIAKLVEKADALQAKLDDASVKDAQNAAEELESKIVILDRLANGPFLDIYSTINSIKAVGPAFGLLFLIVGAMVTFSTLVIIIDEQKKLVGTTKAFGFHNNEILGKYMIFGLAAAVIGVMAGILLGILLSRVGLHAILGPIGEARLKTGILKFVSHIGLCPQHEIECQKKRKTNKT